MGGLISGLDAAGPIITAGMGMLNAKWSDNRQYHQQKKFQRQQIEGAKELGDYNQALALDTWNKTNYEAQVKHMQEAGLNVGLMYKGSGGGGTTSGGQVALPTAGQAQNHAGTMGMAMQLGLQAAMQKAQIELTKAETEKTKVEAAKTAGVDTEESKARTTNLQWDAAIKEIERDINKETMWDAVAKVRETNKILVGQANQELAKGEIEQATYDERIKQAEQDTVEQQLRMGAIKAGIIQTGEQTQQTKMVIKEIAKKIQNMSFEQRMEWEKLDLQAKETWIKQVQLELNKQGVQMQTNAAAHTQQWANVIGTVLGSTPKPGTTINQYQK